MKLRISHRTTYHYDEPVGYALQQLRLRPKSRVGQKVLDWSVTVENGKRELEFVDQHANRVDLISIDAGTTNIVILSEGTVDITDQAGIVGAHAGHVPLWLFQRDTPLTKPGRGIMSLLSALKRSENALDTLHSLSAAIRERVPYSTEQSLSDLTAEDAIMAGRGVCQDHAHIFVTAIRQLGFPARYVSGYLMMNDRIDQNATHAWAEAHIDGLGWVGVDVSNGISPDDRYVRVATGLDYSEAAPVSGMRFGTGSEQLKVQLQVQQQ